MYPKFRSRFRLLLVFQFLIVACGGPHQIVEEGSGENELSAQANAVGYEGAVEQLFQQRCSVCHNATSPHGDWSKYEQAFAKKDRIFEMVVVTKKMPMGMALSDEEIALVARWVKTGGLRSVPSAVEAEVENPEDDPVKVDEEVSEEEGAIEPGKPEETEEEGEPEEDSEAEEGAEEEAEEKEPEYDLEKGKSIYMTTCFSCHGVNGKGAVPGMTPDFTKPDGRLSKEDDVLIENIWNGYQSPGSAMPMPAKGGNPALVEDDVIHVIYFMREEFLKKEE